MHSTIGEHVEGSVHPKHSHVLPFGNMMRVASKAFPCITMLVPLGNMIRVASKAFPLAMGNIMRVASKAFPCITIGEHDDGCIQATLNNVLALEIV